MRACFALLILILTASLLCEQTEPPRLSQRTQMMLIDLLDHAGYKGDAQTLVDGYNQKAKEYNQTAQGGRIEALKLKGNRKNSFNSKFDLTDEGVKGFASFCADFTYAAILRTLGRELITAYLSSLSPAGEPYFDLLIRQSADFFANPEFYQAGIAYYRGRNAIPGAEDRIFEYLYLSGQRSEALQMIDRATGADPNLRVKLLEEFKQYDQAIPIQLESDPGNHERLARLYYLEGNDQAALDQFVQCGSKDNKLGSYILANLGRYTEAKYYADLEDTAAEWYLNQILRLARGDYKTSAEQGKDYELSLPPQLADRLIRKLNPTSREWTLSELDILIYTGRYQDAGNVYAANAYYQQAIGMYAKTGDYARMSEMYELAGDLANAIKFQLKADSENHSRLASLYEKNGQAAQAVESYLKSGQADEAIAVAQAYYPPDYKKIFDLCLQQGRTELAAAYVDSVHIGDKELALRLALTGRMTEKVKQICIRDHKYKIAGEHIAGVDSWQAAVEFYVENEQYALAAELMEKNDPEDWYSLAELYRKSGNTAKYEKYQKLIGEREASQQSVYEVYDYHDESIDGTYASDGGDYDYSHLVYVYGCKFLYRIYAPEYTHEENQEYEGVVYNKKLYPTAEMAAADYNSVGRISGDYLFIYSQSGSSLILSKQ